VALIGVAAAAVLAVGAIAFAARDRGSAAGAQPGADIVTATAPGSVPATVGALGSEHPGPVTITGLQELDPPPGDGAENPAGLAALTDGDPATAWTTVCYESKYLYPKEGVGLVIGLSGPVAGQQLLVQWPAGPWRASVYTADTPGADLKSWGQPVARRGSDQPGEARFALGHGDGRYVLLWLTQLARSNACSANPYRGAISELAVEPAG
jgi:putative peptidoglycan lipid II flippase